jgi:hypothetical protein
MKTRFRQRSADQTSVPPWERLSELDAYHELVRARLEGLVAVREPLVLVSQVQRSGGTLLNQLFDGHRECHVHPDELKIGSPRKWNWPSIDLEKPDEWFDLLYEEAAGRHLSDGYHKSPRPQAEQDFFPFLFLPRLQRAIFERTAALATSERAVLDAYFTSYFNAWVDNHNLYSGPKKAVVGFVPWLNAEPGELERFFGAYPDGTLVTLVRHPCSWYASARSHGRSYTDLDSAIERWRTSALASLSAAERFGERVVLLTYESLVGDVTAAMGALCARVGLTMSDDLCTPTFNGRPIRANSSDPVDRYGVLPERAEAYRESLEPDVVRRIEARAGDVYETVAARVGA